MEMIGLQVLGWSAFLLIFSGIRFLAKHLVCRLAGVHVERITLGIGPVLHSTFRGDTELQFRTLPIAVYQAIAGLDPAPGGPKAAIDRGGRSFATKSFLVQIAILLSGVLGTTAFSQVLLAGALHVVGSPRSVARVGEVVPGGPADRSGLRSGDRLTQVDGMMLESTRALIQYIREHPGRQIRLTVRRGDEALELVAVPADQDGQGKLGIVVESESLPQRAYPGWRESFEASAEESALVALELIRSLKFLVIPSNAIPRAIGGPISIVRTGTAPTISRADWMVTIARSIAAQFVLFSLVCLLPVPGLDGWRLLRWLLGRIRLQA
jgi:membrane-associated protease RseP (regulator of RpoE activity)